MDELYELPKGWEWKNIGETCENLDRLRKPITQKDRIHGIYPYYGATKIVDYINDYIFDEQLILIGEDGAKWDTGDETAFIANGKYWVNNHAHVIKPDRSILIDSWLVYYLFITDLSKYITGTTVPKLNQAKLKGIVFPLPPLKEQKRIILKLDNIFSKIDKSITLNKQNIYESNTFLGSVLNDTFKTLNNNNLTELKNVTSKIGSGSTPRGGQKAYKTEGISLIRSMNVHDDGFREKGLAFIDDEQAKKLDNVTIQENDVLLNITGASVARCCIVDKNYLPARVNQHVSILRLKDEMLPAFLHYYLISPTIKTELLKSSSGGATREAITKTMLEEFQVPVVPLSQQEKIVTYLDEISQKIEKIKSVQTEKMESLVALKASILDQAFRGEL